MYFLRLNKNIKVRIVEQFLTSLVANSIFPFMIIYFSERFGTGLTGVLTGANIIIGFIAGFYGGHIADQYGRRILMIKAEYVRLVSTIIMTIFSLPRLDSPVLVYLMMTVNAICTGFSRPAGEAMIIDASSEEDRKYIYGLDYWLWNVSIFVGSILGGFLFHKFRFELLIVLSVLSVVTLILLIFFIDETYVAHEQQIQQVVRKNFFFEMFKNYQVIINDTRFKIFIIASLTETAVQFQSMNYSVVRLAKEVPTQSLKLFGHMTFLIDGYKVYGLLNSINTIVVVVLGLLVSKLTNKINNRKALYSGIILYSLGYSYISYDTHPLLLMFAMGIVAIGEFVYIPRKQAILAEIVPHRKRGAYMAINALTLRAASMIGSLSLTLGTIFPSMLMSFEIFIFGLFSLFFYSKVVDKDVVNQDYSLITK